MRHPGTELPKGQTSAPILLVIVLGMAVLFRLTPLTLANPPAANPTVDLIQVNAVAVPGPGGGYTWRMTSIPPDTAIQVTDWKVKKLLGSNLAYARAYNAGGRYSDLDSFEDALLQNGAPLRLRFPPLPAPKSAHDVFPMLRGSFTASPPQVPHPLRIDVAVQGSNEINQHPVTTSIGALQAHGLAVPGTLSAGDRATVVRIYGDGGPAANATPWVTSDEHTIAYQAAVQAFVAAQQAGLPLQDQGDKVPNGQQLPSDKVRSQVMSYVTGTFDLLGSWNPIPPGPSNLVTWQNNLWNIRVPLLAVGNVSFQITGLHAGKDFSWSDFMKTNWYAAGPAAFEANRKKVETEMTQSLQPVFSKLSHTLVTKAEFMNQEKQIDGIVDWKRLTEPATIAATGVNDLAVLAVLYPTVSNFSVGGGYSNDKHLFGSANASFTKEGMTGSATAEAGQKKQDGTLSFSLPDYLPSKDDQWSAGVGVTGNFTRATGLQLNRPDDPATDTDNGTAEILHTLKFTSVRAAAGETAAASDIYQAALQTAVGYSYVTWDQHDAAAPALQSGGFWYLRADLNQEWVHTFAKPDQPGPGSLDLLVDTNLKRGFNAGPADFDFTKFGVSATATFYFGRVTSTDYFVRAIAGGGTMSGNAPVTEEFGLGGNDIMRGLDQDERTARGLFWQSVEMGVTLESIVRLLPLPASAADKKPASGQTQNLLSSTYVSGFAEFAEITQTSASQTQHLSSNLQSYGVALEFNLSSGSLAAPKNGGTTQMRIGYAWSPESVHRSGLFFTDVSIPIF